TRPRNVPNHLRRLLAVPISDPAGQPVTVQTVTLPRSALPWKSVSRPSNQLRSNCQLYPIWPPPTKPSTFERPDVPPVTAVVATCGNVPGTPGNVVWDGPVAGIPRNSSVVVVAVVVSVWSVVARPQL